MVEYLYHVNEQDTVLGKIERTKAHKEHTLHRSGLILVFNKEGKLFLTKRSSTKSIYPNCIDTACSFHVKYGKTYLQEAKRELFEETKIRATPKQIGKFLLNYGSDKMSVAVFVLKTTKKITLDKSEATSGKYYSLTEAKKLIKKKRTTSWLREAIKLI